MAVFPKATCRFFNLIDFSQVRHTNKLIDFGVAARAHYLSLLLVFVCARGAE